MDDRARLECIVTEVFIENLDTVDSHLDDCDELERMRSAATR